MAEEQKDGMTNHVLHHTTYKREIWVSQIMLISEVNSVAVQGCAVAAGSFMEIVLDTSVRK